MDKFLIFTIVVLSTAAIYAVIASGLVLTYTTTGVFNFAHGAAGMLAAFAYWQIRVKWGWSTPVALILVLLILSLMFGGFRMGHKAAGPSTAGAVLTSTGPASTGPASTGAVLAVPAG